MDLLWVFANPGSTTVRLTPPALAFFGVIDILAIIPYFIEILLHQDTVSQASSAPAYPVNFV
jgi:hypothetical protein